MTTNTDTPKKSNKLLKGGIAAAAAVALLLGGAGTFALWQDVADFGVESPITAGNLHFTGDPSDGEWTLTSADGQTISDVDPSAVFIVPGDVLTYTVDGLGITGTGNTLDAQLGVHWGDSPAGSNPEDVALYNNLVTAFTLSDGDLDQTVTSSSTIPLDINSATAQSWELGTVTVTITFNDVDGLTAQNGTVDLNGFGLTLNQVLPNS